MAAKCAIRWKRTGWPMADWGRVVAISADKRFEILYQRRGSKHTRYYARDTQTNYGSAASSFKLAQTKACRLKEGWDPLPKPRRR